MRELLQRKIKLWAGTGCVVTDERFDSLPYLYTCGLPPSALSCVNRPPRLPQHRSCRATLSNRRPVCVRNQAVAEKRSDVIRCVTQTCPETSPDKVCPSSNGHAPTPFVASSIMQKVDFELGAQQQAVHAGLRFETQLIILSKAERRSLVRAQEFSTEHGQRTHPIPHRHTSFVVTQDLIEWLRVVSPK